MCERADPAAAVAITRPVILLLGPTAGGKTALGIELAQRLPGGGVLIAADSMQVYRGMDLGTAKPTAEERARAEHLLIDVADPGDETFSVERWLTLAQEAIEAVRRRGRWPIVVGGTNLYIKALLDGLLDGPAPDAALRAELGEWPLERLRTELERIDPVAAERIHPSDQRRSIRAIEVFRATGRRLSELQVQWRRGSSYNCEQATPVRDGPDNCEPATPAPSPPASVPATTRRAPLVAGMPDSTTPTASTASAASSTSTTSGPILIVGLDWPVEAINRRINARVRAMVELGLFGEVERLDREGRLGRQAREALGYKQILDHLAGRLSREDAIEQIKIRSRRYAKQQRTWLKRFRVVAGIPSRFFAVSDESAAELVDAVAAWVLEAAAPERYRPSISPSDRSADGTVWGAC